MKVLFFSPHNYYLVHSLPEALVAESLKYKGAEILYVGCNGILNNYCICMSGIKSDSSANEKSKICNSCKLFRDQIYGHFKVNYIYLDDFIKNEDLAIINNLIEGIDINNIQDFKYLDFEVGKISLYEFLLNRKLNTTLLNIEEFTEYKLYVRNTLITLIAGIQIFKNYQIDRLITYNSYYSVNNMMCSIAASKSIPNFTLHAGSHHKYRLSEMTIFKGQTEPLLINQNSKWFEYSQFPLSKKAMYKVYEHIIYLLSANSPWVYSVKSNKLNEFILRERLGIKSNQKVLLALMASADERFAANIIGVMPDIPTSFFPTQIDWINYLINLAKSDSNLFIIIRVHPREFPNKREQVLSKQAVELLKIFVDLPNNCQVNYPSDNISLHDLIKITDVGLNATSTAGLELLLFGIPVVIYDEKQLFSYGREMNLIANDPIEYKNKIYEAIDIGLNLNNIIFAFRWIAYKSEVVSIDISDGYTNNENKIKKLIIYYFGNRLFKSSVFDSLKYNGKKLKETEKLTYAIINDELSHINSVIVDKGNCIKTEKKHIKKLFKKYCNAVILHKDDTIYKQRINRMLNTL